MRTGNGEVVAADAVICAAGIGTPALLAEAGFELPFTTPEGLLVHSEPLRPFLSRLIIAPGMHVRQTREGRLVAGFDFAGTVVEEPKVAASRIFDLINLSLDVPGPLRLDFTTLGLRPTPGDGFPAVGWVPGVRGLYLASMHSGMTLAPGISLFAADEILEGTLEPLLAPYRPERFVSGRDATSTR